MHVSRRFSPVLAGLLTCLAVLAISATAALAAPITVDLRVEGSSATLFEGPVSTEALPALLTSSTPTAHPCDISHNGSNGGFVPPGASATSALYNAVVVAGLPFDAEWFSSFNDFEVTQVGPDRNGGEAEGFPSWGYAVNYTTAGVGGCQFQLASGSEVLWAYNYFNLPHLLRLSGPSSVVAGVPFVVHVTDAQNGTAMDGATIGELIAGVTTSSAAVTDSRGDATVVLAQSGAVTLKATAAESVRSNGLAVCVHAGDDGSCGTTVAGGSSGSPETTTGSAQSSAGALARALGLANGRVYSRRFAPRVLRGMVKLAPGGTLRQVRIRLQRRSGRRCFDFSGSRVRFVRSARCAPAAFFSVGSAESFSYLLPERLPAGRYVYDIEAVDSAGRVTGLVGGVSHVVFRVSSPRRRGRRPVAGENDGMIGGVVRRTSRSLWCV